MLIFNAIEAVERPLDRCFAFFPLNSRMKVLTVVRHAKSSWKNPSLRDFDRPLNKRGKKDAKLFSEYIAKNYPAPDRIVSSPAKRAIIAAEHFHAAFKMQEVQLIHEKIFYFEGRRAVIERIASFDDEWKSVYIFGHNPDWHDLVEHLTGKPIAHFPTLALASISFEVSKWADLEVDCGKLDLFLFPKMMSWHQ